MPAPNFMGGPPPRPRPQKKVEKPHGIKDIPRWFEEVVGGFFGRLFYIVRLVFEANPAILFLMAFFCLLSGVMPVIGAYITSALLSAIQELLKTGVTVKSESIAVLLDELVNGAFRPVLFLLVFQFTYMFLHRLSDRLSSMVNSVAGELVSNHIRVKIMNKAKAVDLASYDRPEFYEKLENANREAGMRPLQIMRSTFSVFSTVISAISFIAVLATLSPWAPIAIVLFALPTAYVSMHYRTKNFHYMRRSSTERRKMEYFSQLVTNRDRIKENRIMGLSDTFIDTYQDNFKVYYKGIKRLIVHEGVTQSIISILSLLINCALFTFVAFRVVVEGAPIGDYSLYTSALTNLSGYISTLVASIAAIYEGTLFIDNMMVFMKEETTVTPCIDPPVIPKKGAQHTIEFRHVYFRYPGADRDVLHDVNLVLRPNETVVIVGLNGAGKTTLIKLLTRLYDPTSGEILLDGVDLRDYDVKALYDLYGIIFQDFGKYAVSAAENIAYGDVKKPIDGDAVKTAAVRGNADGFIQELRDGYDTPLSRFFDEKGVDLSIGQWQKLSIARAFYKESDIMILDEPTASLDPLAEQEVFNQFSALGKDRITIFVSHRLSSATIASLILVMENGRIIERGTHAELMREHGRYCHLFSTQAKRYAGKDVSGDFDDVDPDTQRVDIMDGMQKPPRENRGEGLPTEQGNGSFRL